MGENVRVQRDGCQPCRSRVVARRSLAPVPVAEYTLHARRDPCVSLGDDSPYAREAEVGDRKVWQLRVSTC